MGYGRKIYEQASAQLERSRRGAEEAAARQVEEFYSRCPQAREVKEQMGANAARAARAVIQGGSVRAELEKLRDKGLALQAEYSRLLQSQGLTQEDVSPRYACPRCQDTGFIDGRMCQCLKQLQRAMAYERLSMQVPLEKSTFETFSLDYYKEDPRAYRQMERVLHTCQEYAARFRSDSSSLLFKGATGLGKTHLSLAIAGKAIEKGFGVIYGSAQSFAVALEKERFERQDPDGPGDANSQLLGCDLLILDDLGAEFPSQYVNAALYNVVNARMMAGRPTIISTNLSLKELEQRYSERFASRVSGYYGMLEFTGSDVRGQMLARRQAGR